MTVKAIVFDAYGTLFDVQSVEDTIESAFPGFGDAITQIWRLKQLEYTWLRSLMGRYEDFWAITKDSLGYTLEIFGQQSNPQLVERIAQKYNSLEPYADTKAALESLSGYRLAILSNGTPAMLQALVRNAGFEDLIGPILSVDSKKIFKPHPLAYQIVEEELALSPQEVLFVSSNGFDVSGAKSFGFTVAQVDRVARSALQSELQRSAVTGPDRMFQALRSQPEMLGFSADFRVKSLRELANRLSKGYVMP